MIKDVFPIIAPQLNVNDDTVEFIGWKVANGSRVAAGIPICEINTMKALFEITAETDGIIHQIALPHTIARVGECLGLIGKERGSIDRYLSEMEKKRGTDAEKSGHDLSATPKAQKLAKTHNISLEEVVSIGVKGTIKEADVMRYLAGRKDIPTIPPWMLSRVEEEGRVPYQKTITGKRLTDSLGNRLRAVIDAEIDLTPVNAFIQALKERGSRVTLLPVVMHALGRTLSKYRNFTTFHFNDRLYKYREVDVAFIVKTFDGPLYAPVVRNVDRIDTEKIAEECAGLTLKANRHKLSLEDMEGACFTVSYIPHSAISRFEALINEFQSAILAISGEKKVATMTLSYDHAVLDGWDSALFLENLIKEISNTVKTQ